MTILPYFEQVEGIREFRIFKEHKVSNCGKRAIDYGFRKECLQLIRNSSADGVFKRLCQSKMSVSFIKTAILIEITRTCVYDFY